MRTGRTDGIYRKVLQNRYAVHRLFVSRLHGHETSGRAGVVSGVYVLWIGILPTYLFGFFNKTLTKDFKTGRIGEQDALELVDIEMEYQVVTADVRLYKLLALAKVGIFLAFRTFKREGIEVSIVVTNSFLWP